MAPLTLTAFTLLVLVALSAFSAHAQKPSSSADSSNDYDGLFSTSSQSSSRMPRTWLLDQFSGRSLAQAVREELAEQGVNEDSIDSVLYGAGVRLLRGYLLHLSPAHKRAMGWKRIPIQTRFAPFGTKLVPSRNRGDANGPTLLRYGRSALLASSSSSME